MWPAFPASDYYGSSAPPRQHQPATGLPAGHAGRGRGGDRRDGSHVHSRTVRRVRRPAMPLQHRHGYAADLHRGLPAGDIAPAKEFPAPPRAGARCNPAPIRQVRAGGSLEEAFSRWFLTYTFPSCLPDPDHLAVLARPGVVRAAFHPHPRPRDQAAPSFTGPLRRARRRCPFTTARSKSASWRSASLTHRTTDRLSTSRSIRSSATSRSRPRT